MGTLGLTVFLAIIVVITAVIDNGTAKIYASVQANTTRLEPEYTPEQEEIFTENVRNAGVADNMYIEDAILALRSVGCSAKEAKSIVDKLASEKMYYSFEEFLADAIRSL
jgi:Holliday junction resolvasome RuvABC DNA-binding subunit